MFKYLVFIAFITSFYFLPNAAKAQGNQTVVNGAATTAVTFPGTCTYNWTIDNSSIGLAGNGTGNIPSFTAINNTNAPITATVTATVVGGFAYIPNFGSNTISVISTTTHSVVATIPSGFVAPDGVCVSPDGSRAYVIGYGGSVMVIDAITNTLISTISTISAGGYLDGIAISPDGGKVYVSTRSSPSSVLVISTATNTIINTINISESAAYADATGIAVSPDGKWIYVADIVTGNLFVLNAQNYTTVAKVHIGDSPIGVTVSPDGNKVYVSANAGNVVAVVNATTNLVESQIPLIAPYSEAFSPDGSKLYLTHAVDNTILVLDALTNLVITTIPVGNAPTCESLSPDGKELYVSNHDSNNVSIINTSTNTVIATVAVGNQPIAFGKFVTGGIGCQPSTFTITVNPSPNIITSAATGNITANAGTASANPNIEQFGCNTGSFSLHSK